MAKKIDICKKCNQDCEVPCAALNELFKIYAETRTREKKQLIHNLKKYLNIADAEPSRDLEKNANKIIKKLPELNYIPDFNIKIGYVKSFERKTKSGKATYADCRKVSEVYSAYLPFDFIITFYEMNIGHLSENQLKILMWHELMHIGIGNRGFTIVPHDIEDFYSIIDVHGTRWDELGDDIVDILE